MKVISIKTHPEYEKTIVDYFKRVWGSESTYKVYEDAIKHAKQRGLPNWYLLIHEEEIVGCAGLITNDFISRMDLYPWLAALFIEEEHRGHGYGKILIDQIKTDAKSYGFKNLYLCTDHVGYYERYGFSYIADGFHPWGETSSIFECKL
ncbi:GNAT family N-acetyltransferase [Tenericutes bacterium MZ-XQ]|jgi:GNAT superfamily N-acetyltransferase|nr:GNAT family N-acetyltransferase [Tenericutes bacterium MZ-XQ]